jgi:catechol-2,3-dioxygenase
MVVSLTCGCAGWQGGKVAEDYNGSNTGEIASRVTRLLPQPESRRALHWVLKIGNLKESLRFFETVLGMRVLRHEEFESGCEGQLTPCLIWSHL